MAVSRVLATIVNKYASDYVAPLEKSSISFGLGSFSLSDISFSPSFLNSLGFPINILAVHLGKMTIKINPAQMKLAVLIDGVDVLTDTQVRIPTLDAQKALEACVKFKLGILAADEKLALGGAPSDGSIYFTLAKYLQVEIEKTHIRVQHCEGGRNSGLGILLWHAGMNSSKQTKRNATSLEPGYSAIPLTITKVEVYMSVGSSPLAPPYASGKDMQAPFEDGFELKDSDKVLDNFAGALFLQNQHSHPDLPFVHALLNTPGMTLTLSQVQLRALMGYASAINVNGRQLVAIYEDATREVEGRDGTPNERACYLTLYQATLNTDIEWLPHMKKQKDTLERNIKTKDIVKWRHDAIEEVKERKKAEQVPGKKGEPLVTLRPVVNMMAFYVAGGLAAALLLLYIWSWIRGFSIGIHAPFYLFITVTIALSMLVCLALGIQSALPQSPIVPKKKTGAPVLRTTLRTGRVSATLLDCMQLSLKDLEAGFDYGMRDQSVAVSLTLAKCDIEDSRAIAPVNDGEQPTIHQRILEPYRKLLHAGPMKISFAQSSMRDELPHRDISLKSQEPVEFILGANSPVWIAVQFASSLPKVSSEEEKASRREIKHERKEMDSKIEEDAELKGETTHDEVPPFVALLVEVDLQAKAKIVCTNTEAISYIIQLDTTVQTRVDMKKDMAITGNLEVGAILDRVDYEEILEPFDPIPIIVPFSTKVYVHMYPNEFFGGQQGMSVTLDVGNIMFTFTTELYRIVMKYVIPIVTPPKNENKEEEEEEKQAVEEEAPAAVIEAGAPAPLVPASAFVPPKAYTYGSQSFVVTLGELRVHLVNDMLSVPSPLARVILGKIHSRLHSFGHERSLFARLDVQGDFYNDRIIEWEPLIEPFNVLAGVTQSLHPLRYPKPNFALAIPESKRLDTEFGFLNKHEVKQFNDVTIRTKGIMDLNVTHAMNARIQDLMRMIKSVDDEEELKNKPEPYMFENCTEFKMNIVMVDSGEEKKRKVLTLEPYSMVPFSFREQDPHKHKVCVEMKGTPWAPFAIQVSKVGVTAHAFLWEPPKDAREDMPESEWKPDSVSKYCDHCGKEFSLLVRHHHCRSCGLVFCSKCSHDKVDGKRYCVDCKDFQVRSHDMVDVQLVVQIEIRQGIKAISLHSPIGIKNDTRTPMLLSLPLTPACLNWNANAAVDHFAKSEPKPFVPNEIWWVPLLQAAYFSSKEIPGLNKVYIRPADEYSPFDWSKPISLRHPPIFPASRGFECRDQARKLELNEAERTRPNFHFTVLHEEEEEEKTKEKKEKEKEQNLPEPKPFTLYYCRDSVIVENLLPIGMHIQLFNNVQGETGLLVGESTVEKGKQFHVGSSSLEPTWLKLHLVGYEPSAMIDLKLTDKTDKKEPDRNVKIPLKPLLGEIGLTAEVEIEKQFGVVRLMVFVPYWFFDFTDLQLKFSEIGDEKEVIEKEEKRGEMRHAQMFNFTKKKHAVFVRSRLSKWSNEPAPVDNVGLSGQVYMTGLGETPDAVSGIQYEIGIMVKKATGRFSRTTIVEFSPRHVIQNTLPQDIMIHQYATQTPDFPDLITLKAGATMVYHSRIATSDLKGKGVSRCALSFRRVGDESLKAFNWSGYFDLDAVGDQVIAILDRVSLRCFYARIFIRLEGATVFVRIGNLLGKQKTLKDLTPTVENIASLRYGVHFAVENRTTNQLMRFRQLHNPDRDTIMAAEETVWQEVNPGRWVPYDWVEPLHSARLVIEVGLLPPREEQVELGELKFIAYIDEMEGNQAVVRVRNISGSGLRAMDRNLIGQRTTSDPYIGLRIVPGVGNARTSTKKKDLNPEWRGEEFDFPVHTDQLAYHALELRVMDQDTVRDDCIGYVTVALNHLPKYDPANPLPSASHKIKPHPLGFKKFKYRTVIDPNTLSASVARFGRRGPAALRVFVVPDGPLNVIALSNSTARKYEPFPPQDLFANLQPERTPEPVENLLIAGPPAHARVELTLKVIGGRHFTIAEPLYCRIEFMKAIAQTEPVLPAADGTLVWRKKFSTVLRLDRLERADPDFIFSLYSRRDIRTDSFFGQAQLSWNAFDPDQEEVYLPFVDSTGVSHGEVRLMFSKRELYPEDYEAESQRRGSEISRRGSESMPRRASETDAQSRRGSEVEFKVQNASRRNSEADINPYYEGRLEPLRARRGSDFETSSVGSERELESSVSRVDESELVIRPYHSRTASENETGLGSATIVNNTDRGVTLSGTEKSMYRRGSDVGIPSAMPTAPFDNEVENLSNTELRADQPSSDTDSKIVMRPAAATIPAVVVNSYLMGVQPHQRGLDHEKGVGFEQSRQPFSNETKRSYPHDSDQPAEGTTDNGVAPVINPGLAPQNPDASIRDPSDNEIDAPQNSTGSPLSQETASTLAKSSDGPVAPASKAHPAVAYMEPDKGQTHPEAGHKEDSEDEEEDAQEAEEEEQEKERERDEEAAAVAGKLIASGGPVNMHRDGSTSSLDSAAEEEEADEELLTLVHLAILGVQGLQDNLGDLWNYVRIEGIVEIVWPGMHKVAAFLIKDANGLVDFGEWERKMEILIPDSVLRGSPYSLKISFHIDKEPGVNVNKKSIEEVQFPFVLGEVSVDLTQVPLDEFKQNMEENIKHDKGLSKTDKKRQSDDLKEQRDLVESWKSKECPVILTNVTDSKRPEPQVLLSIIKHESRAFNRRPYFRVTADVDGIGASLIDGKPQEIAYLSLRKFHVRLEDALEQSTMEMSLDRVQLDNQLPDATFDIVLAPTAVPKDKKKPVLQSTAIMLKDTRHSCMMFQQFAVLLQSLDLRVEEMLLWNMLSYINQFYSASEEEPPSEEDSSKAAVVPKKMSGKKDMLFFRELGLQPIAINLTFRAANPDQRSGGHGKAGGPLGMLLKTILATVTVFAGNISGSELRVRAGRRIAKERPDLELTERTRLVDLSDAPLRLNAKLCNNVKGDQAYILKVFMDHYIREAIMEAYKVVGSLDFLGNPVGLANNMSTGVTDMFYEPAAGLMKSPEDFGKGLAKGSTSLLTHTLGGVFGTVSTISGAVGSLASTLTMDQEFIKQRTAKTAKPKHALSGVVKGARSVGRGFSSGVKGVVEQPRKGVKEEGGAGLVKGVGKGIVGLGVKPVVGIIDGVSLTLKGIGNTADYLLNEQVENKPVRKQRYMPHKTLISYAEGEKQRPAEKEEKSKIKKLLSRG